MSMGKDSYSKEYMQKYREKNRDHLRQLQVRGAQNRKSYDKEIALNAKSNARWVKS